MLEFRAECRAYAAHWMDVQRGSSSASASPATGSDRYATMDLRVGGGDRRRDRQVPAERRAVSRPAPGDVEPGREDRAGRGRDRVPRPHQHHDLGALPGAARRRSRTWSARSVVIWTTTPWTMPGQPRRRLRARRSTTRWCMSTASPKARWRRAGETRAGRAAAAAAVLRRTPASRRITSMRVLKGAELAGTICAHPLRGQRLRLRRAGAARRFRHHRGRHRLRPHRPRPWRGRFRPRPRPRPASAGDGGRRRHLHPPGAAASPALHVFKAAEPIYAALPRPAGMLVAKRQAGALLPAFLALQGAGDLPRHAAMVHRAWTAPTQIRAQGAGGHRRNALRARPGPQPHRQHGRRPAGLVHQPPARLGRADRRLRRRSTPASRCATRP